LQKERFLPFLLAETAFLVIFSQKISFVYAD